MTFFKHKQYSEAHQLHADYKDLAWCGRPLPPQERTKTSDRRGRCRECLAKQEDHQQRTLEAQILEAWTQTSAPGFLQWAGDVRETRISEVALGRKLLGKARAWLAQSVSLTAA